MPTLTPNFNFQQWDIGDTVQAATSELNANWSTLDDYAHIVGFGAENGFTWLRIRVVDTVNQTTEDLVMMWGNFTYADAKYNCQYAIGDGSYKSPQSNTDTTRMVTLSFPTFAALTSVQTMILNGAGDMNGANSPQSYAHMETEAVFLDYTVSNNKKTGFTFYWTCPKQESSGVWAKQANIFIIGVL